MNVQTASKLKMYSMMLAYIDRMKDHESEYDEHLEQLLSDLQEYIGDDYVRLLEVVNKEIRVFEDKVKDLY